jgi:hypothetical protein
MIMEAPGRFHRPPLFVALIILLVQSVTAAQQLNLNNPEEALKASRKIHCSLTDGEPVVYWWTGHVYSRIPGERDRKIFNA